MVSTLERAFDPEPCISDSRLSMKDKLHNDCWEVQLCHCLIDLFQEKE